MARVVVMGQGYVGLPLAMLAAQSGHEVLGYEPDPARWELLKSEHSYVEDVPEQILQEVSAQGLYQVTLDDADLTTFGWEVAVVTVPTPLMDRVPDLSYVEAACATLARSLRPGCTVILESTTYPGTTEEFVIPLLEQGSGLEAGADFFVGFSPERIDPGNRQWTLKNTPKIVSGIEPASLASVDSFYMGLGIPTVQVSSPKSAELAKILENTYRHVNIALVNELAALAHDLGIDVWEAIEAAATKPFGFQKFTPGPGVGGHCLPIDPAYLAWRAQQKVGRPFRFVELANDVNDHQPDYVVTRTIRILNEMGIVVPGSKVLLVGLAYKKNSGDCREAPAKKIAELLSEWGAELIGYDPYVEVPPTGWRLGSVAETDDFTAALQWSDVAILLTDHDSVPHNLMEQGLCQVLDTRGVLEPSDMVERL